MVVLTTRQRDVLLYLIAKPEYATMEDLASFFCISKRTVWNDLKQIDAFVAKTNTYIEKKSNAGVKIVANEEDRRFLKTAVKSMASRVLTAKERELATILIALSNDNVTLEYLAAACYVSRKTTIRDFDRVEQTLRANNLTVTKKQGKGISISGDEKDIRKMFERAIFDAAVDDTMVDIIYRSSRLLDYEEVAQAILSDLAKVFEMSYIDDSKVKILIEFNLHRIKQGDSLQRMVFEETKEDEITEVLAKYIDSIYDVKYLKSLLVFTRISHRNKVMGNIDDEASAIAEFLLERLQLLHEMNENVIEQISGGFTQHLRVAIYRIKNNITIENELLNQIKISIPLIYAFTKRELAKCEKRYGLDFDDNEIAYIAMYISSIYENSLAVNDGISIMLVCSFGLATSSILKTRMLSILPNCVLVGPFSEQQAIAYMQQNEVGLIIATHDLAIDTVKTITVNPLLNPQDVDHIKNTLFQVSYSRMCDLFIKAYSKLEEEQTLDIALKDYVNYDDIQIVERCSNWQAAIELVARPLKNKGQLEQRYINKMIEAVISFGTYMVLVDGVAFIHAGTNDGINDNCTSILVLKQPTSFGEKNPKNVWCLVVLGIRNKEENSLLNLVRVFENKANVLKLRDDRIEIDDIYKLTC